MTDLYPAAQAVLDVAFTLADNLDRDVTEAEMIAAALRAAADQNDELDVPFAVVDEWEKVKGSCARFYAAAEWGRAQALKELLAIAEELDSV